MNETRRNLTGCLALAGMLGLGIVPGAVAASHGRRPARVRVTHPRRGAAFVGVSSQKSGKLALPVDIRASANARFMSRFDIEWSAACQGVVTPQSYGGLSITLNRKISPSGVFTNSSSFSKDFAAGGKGLFLIRLYGRFTSPVRAAGTFRVTAAITNVAGARTSACDSGVVHWSATN